MPENCINYILQLFNRVIIEEKIPQSWTKIDPVMIYRKGNKLDYLNYRPIALLNCILQLFTKVLSGRLNNWFEVCNLVPESQCGFREKRSCLDSLFTFNAMIQNRLSLSKENFFVLFIDFKRALFIYLFIYLMSSISTFDKK